MTNSKEKTREITLPPHGYQPGKAEFEKTFDMPSANVETIHNAFFSPVTIRRINLEDE